MTNKFEISAPGAASTGFVLTRWWLEKREEEKKKKKKADPLLVGKQRHPVAN